jgi:hypothetical protein
MERDLAGSRIGKAEFRQLADLCNPDPKFPASFDDWQKLVADGERQLYAENKSVSLFEVRTADFAAWCARVGIHVCFDALRAYLIINHRAAAASAGTTAPASPGPAAPAAGDNDTRRVDLRRLMAALFALPAIELGLLSAE